MTMRHIRHFGHLTLSEVKLVNCFPNEAAVCGTTVSHVDAEEVTNVIMTFTGVNVLVISGKKKVAVILQMKAMEMITMNE